jgi:hypothetical protein
MAKYMWDKSNYSQPLLWQGQKFTEMIEAGLAEREVFEFIGCVIALQSGVEISEDPGFGEEFFQNLEQVGFDLKVSPLKQGKPYAKWNFEDGKLEIL